ncbi:MAG: SusC/RagA family TonB-linked outer membrane protein [Prevotella sp.]|nr:SusC/RagA family TonB-linked outer membrane protein [Prevotella sp.]
MKKHLYILLIAFLAVLPAAAQEVITGTVTEMIGNDEEPCIGVNVTFVNAQNRIVAGTVTDFSGMYTLQVPADKKNLSVQFSYIGMKTQKFKYEGQKTINVKLEADNAQTQLQEVRVTGSRGSRNDLGISAREQAFATQKIKMDEILESQPVTSVEEALQGQLGGVDIVAGGDPGAKSSIRIRGTATLNSNSDPLIVIDGVPYSTDIDDSFDFNTASQEDFAQMLNLNPNDIESIEVLKDAASTAIYGTAGANGVLLITKKKGSRSKTRFSFSTKNSIKIEPKSMPMLTGNQYKAYVQDAIWNSANAQGLARSTDLLNLLYDTPEINYDESFPYFDEYNQNTDWLSLVKKNAFTTDNSFSMSGGGDKANYRFSLGYSNEGGTTKGTGLGRLTTSLNVGYNFSEKLHVEAEYSYTDTQKDAPYTDDVRAAAFIKMPNKSPYQYANGVQTDNYFTRQNADEFQGAYKGTSRISNNKYNFNPVVMANDSYSNSSIKEQKMTVRARWYILPEVLTYNGYVSMRFNTTKKESWLPQAATGLEYGLLETQGTNYTEIDQAAEAYSNSFSLQTENKLMFRKTWNEIHNLVATGIWYTSQSRSSNKAFYRAGVGSAELADVSSQTGILYKIESSKGEVTSLSARGSIAYTLLNRYTINGTFNYEGKSSLGKDNRWGFFPSIGVSWQVQDEPFMKTWKEAFLTQWKVRASWGQSGNAPTGTSPYVGNYSALGNYIESPAIASNTMQLNKLKWETSREINIGTDISLWDGKLTFTFDYYRKNTKDLLQKKVTIPSTTGYSTAQMAWYNSGKMRNEGWEARVDYKVFKIKKWDLSVNFNISHNENTILELPDNLDDGTNSFSLKNGSGYYATKLLSGTSVGSFYGFRYLGVYQNTTDTYAKDAEGNVMTDLQGTPIVMKNGTYTCYPGDAHYDDVNHDGVIDKNDLVYLGNYNPTVTGGGGFTLKYDRFALTVFMHYRLGQKVINAARMDAEGMYNANNQSTAVLRRWRNEGDQTDIPRALWGYGLNQLGSDRYVEDCSFLRFKTISLSYNLPKKFCQSIGLTSANVYLTGYDLFTISNYTGMDPEVSDPSKITDIAKDNAQTPRSRRYSMGITVNF